MDNTLQKLEWRLRSIANGSRKSDDGQCALMRIRVFRLNGSLAGWTKPEVNIIEPRLFNYSVLNIDKALDWTHLVTMLLEDYHYDYTTILIRNGEPIGVVRNQKEAG